MTDYAKLKVAELKELIKERDITATGLKVKQQFVDALVADDEAKAAGEGDEEVNEEVEAKDEDEVTAAAVAEEEGVKEDATGDSKADEAEMVADDSVDANVEESANESAPDSGNKRKRRSPTPPMSEESVQKKLKTAEEKAEGDIDVKLPEDVKDDAPVSVDEGEKPQEKVLPYGSSDDVMDVTGEPQEDSTRPHEDTTMADSDTTGPTSRHPTTRALYIRDLVRPLQPNALREHLLSIAQSSATDDAAIEDFHLDKLRTHAFVLFNSAAAASTARTALHDKVWPDEPQRKPLWVDFIPEDKFREWVDTELERADMTRWEVVYSSTGLDTDGPVVATLQEGDPGASNARKPSVPSRQPPGAGEGMPNAPSGPRRQSTQNQLPPPSPAETPKVQSKALEGLDLMYPFTQTKPKIYYQPVPQALVDRRLNEFETKTSRDWEDKWADPSAYQEGELRRYTFEDGDRLVDGGADFGLFGRHPRGGGRGGGPGRGRGRGGDRYRGGGRR